MTDRSKPERIAALEAVVEAARVHKAAWPGLELPAARDRLHAAVAALDALPAEARAVGETVRVVQFQDCSSGLYALGSDGSLWWSGPKGWVQEPTPPGFAHSTVTQGGGE
jgi:hypothetical protein